MDEQMEWDEPVEAEVTQDQPKPDEPKEDERFDLAEAILIDPATNQLMPTNMRQMIHMSKIYFASGLVSSSFKRAEDVFTAISMAPDLGLTPMQVLNSGYVVNNRLRLHSGMPMALARRTGELEEYDEWLIDKEYNRISLENKNLHADPYAGVAQGKRRGMSKPMQVVFTIGDAQRAGLLKKDNWSKYPGRMLIARARMQFLDYTFADALCGLNDYDDSEFRGFDRAKPVSSTTDEMKEDLNGRNDTV